MRKLTILSLSLLAIQLSAATILDISPNTGGSFRVGGPDSRIQVMGWTQTSALTNVSISALVGSIDGSSRTVNAWLSDGLGAAASPALFSASVVVPSFATAGDIPSQQIFTGLSLGPGTYYLTLFNADTASNVRWARGTTVTFGSGVSGAGEFFADTIDGVPNTTEPWRSTFVTSQLYDFGLTVTGDAVPEPGTLGIMTLGAAAILALRLRKR